MLTTGVLKRIPDDCSTFMQNQLSMRNKFIPLAAVILMAGACNNSTSEAGATPKDTAAAKHDTSGHEGHMATTTKEVPPMPEIPTGAKVFFKNLKNGQTVKSPLKVEMGVEGMALDTANGIVKAASGHHHILIDLDSVAAESVVPKDSIHLHFGNAQSSAEVKLSPGKHKLTLQYADALHRSYGSRLTSTVTVNVKQ